MPAARREERSGAGHDRARGGGRRGPAGRRAPSGAGGQAPAFVGASSARPPGGRACRVTDPRIACDIRVLIGGICLVILGGHAGVGRKTTRCWTVSAQPPAGARDRRSGRAPAQRRRAAPAARAWPQRQRRAQPRDKRAAAPHPRGRLRDRARQPHREGPLDRRRPGMRRQRGALSPLGHSAIRPAARQPRDGRRHIPAPRRTPAQDDHRSPRRAPHVHRHHHRRRNRLHQRRAHVARPRGDNRPPRPGTGDRSRRSPASARHARPRGRPLPR